MLSERKRFNYMNAPLNKDRQREKEKENVYEPGQMNRHDRELQLQRQSQKMAHLEMANQQILEETAKQFRKLQGDVARVEGILAEKEEQITKLKKEGEEFREERALLVQAVQYKEEVISHLVLKLNTLIQQKQENQPKETPKIQPQIYSQPVSTQTQTDSSVDKVDNSTLQQQKYEQLFTKSLQMQDEVYRLRQQLYDMTNKWKISIQQFETYKILKEIDEKIVI